MTNPPTHNWAAGNSDVDFAHESTIWAEAGEDSASLFHVVSAGAAQRLGLLLEDSHPHNLVVDAGCWPRPPPGTVTGMTTHSLSCGCAAPSQHGDWGSQKDQAEAVSSFMTASEVSEHHSHHSHWLTQVQRKERASLSITAQWRHFIVKYHVG